MRYHQPGHPLGLLPYLIHGVFSLIFLALVVVLVLFVARKLRNGQLHMPTFVGMAPNPESDPYLSALKLLNERLANGDIDVDEYYARRTALKGPDPTVQA